jgi:hypothetical protein
MARQTPSKGLEETSIRAQQRLVAHARLGSEEHLRFGEPRPAIFHLFYLHLLMPRLVQSTAGILFFGTSTFPQKFHQFRRPDHRSVWPTRTKGHCKFQESMYSVVCTSLLPCGGTFYYYYYYLKPNLRRRHLNGSPSFRTTHGYPLIRILSQIVEHSHFSSG